jgi:hypothetical protein
MVDIDIISMLIAHFISDGFVKKSLSLYCYKTKEINTNHKWAAALGLCLEKKEKLGLALSCQFICDCG